MKRKCMMTLVIPVIMFVSMSVIFSIQSVIVEKMLYNLRIERLQNSMDETSIKSVIRSVMNSEYNERYKNTLPSEGVFTDTLKLDLVELGILEVTSVVTVSYIDSIPAEVSISGKKYLIGNVKFDNGGFHQITLGINLFCKPEKYHCNCPAVN